MDTNIFEYATRKQLRFSSQKGLLTVEDLWVLPLTHASKVDLDTVAQSVNGDLVASQTQSFVKTNTANIALEVKLDIIKHIIQVKLQEADDKENAVLRKENNEFIETIIKSKEVEALTGKSIKQLKKMQS